MVDMLATGGDHMMAISALKLVVLILSLFTAIGIACAVRIGLRRKPQADPFCQSVPGFSPPNSCGASAGADSLFDVSGALLRAMVRTIIYLSSAFAGLRSDLGRKCVRVIVGRPGAIDARMTAVLAIPKMTPAEAIADILNGYEVGEEDICVRDVARGLAKGLGHEPNDVQRQPASG
jgi:hypothetical protein